MREVLVTGGAGFIGSHLVELLVERTDAVVTVLDSLVTGERSALDRLPPERVRLVVGDVTDGSLVDDLVRGRDAVLHLAAESHNDVALRTPDPVVRTNLLGTAAVLEACRRHDVRLHHVSTDEVLGDLALDEPRRFTEHSPYDPNTPYAATKAGADHLVRAWVRSFGVRATISIGTNTYGPRQHVEKMVPRQVTNVLVGRRPRVYGTGRQVRDWMHVDDHNAAVLAVLERGEVGATYLVGAGCERSNLDLVRTLLRLLGEPEDAYDLVADRPGHDRRYAVDASRLRDELGWAPARTDLETGLAETVDWYRAHEDWWRPRKAAVEAFYAERGQ